MSGFLAMPSFNRDFGTYNPELKQYVISANLQLIFNLPTLSFAVICSLLSGEIGSRFGRRGGYIALGLLSAVGAAIQLGATNTRTLVAGKIVNGAVYGLGASFVPMYISETAPTAVRGMLVSLLQLSINTGQLVATGVWSALSPSALELTPCRRNKLGHMGPDKVSRTFRLRSEAHTSQSMGIPRTVSCRHASSDHYSQWHMVCS